MILSHHQKYPARRRSGWIALAVLAAMPFLSTTTGNAQSDAQEVPVADFPFLIYCAYEGIHHAYYFSRVGPDGRAIYITPDRQAGMITIDGVAERIGGDRPGTCSDKTLDDLRGSGQAFDLPR